VTAETFTSLVNLGAAGAVIIVVIIFLKFQEKREAAWQSFFNTLSAANELDNRRVCEALDRVVMAVNIISTDLRVHDDKVGDRIAAIQTSARRSASKTVPRPDA